MFRHQIIFAGIFSRISNVFYFVLQGKVTSQSEGRLKQSLLTTFCYKQIIMSLIILVQINN